MKSVKEFSITFKLSKGEWSSLINNAINESLTDALAFRSCIKESIEYLYNLVYQSIHYDELEIVGYSEFTLQKLFTDFDTIISKFLANNFYHVLYIEKAVKTISYEYFLERVGDEKLWNNIDEIIKLYGMDNEIVIYKGNDTLKYISSQELDNILANPTFPAIYDNKSFEIDYNFWDVSCGE